MTTGACSVQVRWAGQGQVFEGRREGAPPIRLDSDSKEGPSPTEALLMSLAACMAVDVKMILERGRVRVDDLLVDVTGQRAPDPPRRFVSVVVDVRVTGPGEGDVAKIERAARLSRETYCSVLHTLRPDLEVEISAGRA